MINLKINSFLQHILLITLTSILILPIIYLVSAGFRPNQSIYAPLFDRNTWTDSTIASRNESKISSRALYKRIVTTLKSKSPQEDKLPKELIDSIKKWISSKGKKEDSEKLKITILNYIENCDDNLHNKIYNELFLMNGSLRYNYEIRFSLQNFSIFWTGISPGTKGVIYPVKIWFLNSMVIATSVSIIQVVVIMLGAFALARYRFSGKNAIILIIIVLQIFPASMTMIALYLFLDYLGNIVPALGLDTIPGLILIYLGVGVPLNLWLAKGYFSTLPTSLEESAMIDGASYFQTFYYIIIPIITPIAAVIGILSFIAIYNEFLLATFVLTKPENYTLPLGLNFFSGGETVQFGTFSAISIIGSIPILIFWLLLQKYIIAGLTYSAYKD